MNDRSNPFCPPQYPMVETVRRGVHPMALAVLISALIVSGFVNIALSAMLSVERARANSEFQRATMWRQCAESIQRFIPERGY